ncbi:trehalase-like domain-containing protein [Streptomyces sioyaensis]|uniref:trehalase-like domain-containing protein n=1 Tax=Streptomyces sioyaensis TaxID=67364 RepID=UPI0037D0559A
MGSYALLADGERGALVGPRGEICWMCAPRWHDDAVFAALIAGGGLYAVTSTEPFVPGGAYEDGSLIWRSRWVTRGGGEALLLLAAAAEHGRLDDGLGGRRHRRGRRPAAVAGGGRRNLAPALLDRDLARTGFDSQQTDEPAPAHRPGNLWDPMGGKDGHDHGAHGTFDDHAVARSPVAALARHPDPVAGALLGLGLGALTLTRAVLRRREGC